MIDLGIRLQLLIGPNVPLPAPYAVMDALLELEVRNDARQRDGLQMTFSLGKTKPLDYGLLSSGLLDPPNRVVVVVVMGALPQVLIDGMITDHQVLPAYEPGQSRLFVTAEDISRWLDLEDKSATYPNQSDSAIVTQILSSYASYGLTPRVTTTSDVPLEVDRVPSQQGTDLAYVEQLAARNSFVFYVEPTDVPGFTTAYWGPEVRQGMPQPALTMGMGSETNVERLSFNYNALGPVEPEVTIRDPITGRAVPIPVPSLLHPSLASRSTQAMRTVVRRDTANLDPIQAALRALTSASESSDAVTANGEVDSVRYRRALRARRLVGVRGAGHSYNGLYYVQSVTHRIRRGEYKQSFTLTREGRGAASPVVMV